MQTITTNFGGKKIVINQHFPSAGQRGGGACFELQGSEPGSGDCYLGAVMAEATGEPKMFRDEDEECDGHESLDGAHMGESVYCDGSCRG